MLDLHQPEWRGYCPLFGQPDRPESRRGRIPVPHPVDQYAVKLIHALYDQSFSDKDIAEYLNTRIFQLSGGRQVKFRTKGPRNFLPERSFTRESIREIITNPFYAGLIARHTVKPLDMDDDQLPGVTALDRGRKTQRINPNGSKRAIIEPEHRPAPGFDFCGVVAIQSATAQAQVQNAGKPG